MIVHAVCNAVKVVALHVNADKRKRNFIIVKDFLHRDLIEKTSCEEKYLNYPPLLAITPTRFYSLFLTYTN